MEALLDKSSVAETDAVLAFAIAAATKAGSIARTRRQSGSLSIEQKTGSELTADVDIAIDAHFRDRISEVWPGHFIISEENDGPGATTTDAPTWIIDPLDGTANFARGLNHVAISVAFSVAGTVQLGVVHAPFLDETFWAIRGLGAWRNGERIYAEHSPSLTRAAIATGFPHNRSSIGEIVERLKPLLSACGSVRVLGAPALDICWVADARLTGVLDRVFVWDIAAAGLIASEAGARVTRLPGEYSNGTDYLVAAEVVHDDLLALLR